MNFGFNPNNKEVPKDTSENKVSKYELEDLVSSTDAIEFFDVGEDTDKMTIAHIDQVRNLPSLMISNENIKATVEAGNYLKMSLSDIIDTKMVANYINCRAITNSMNSEVINNVARVVASFADLMQAIPDMPARLINDLYREFSDDSAQFNPYYIMIARQDIFSAYEFDKAKTEAEKEKLVNISQYRINELCNLLFQYYVTYISYHVDHILTVYQYSKYTCISPALPEIPAELTGLPIYQNYPIDTTYIYLKQEVSKYLVNFYNHALHKIIENWVAALYNSHGFVYNDLFEEAREMKKNEKRSE